MFRVFEDHTSQWAGRKEVIMFIILLVMGEGFGMMKRTWVLGVRESWV